MIKIMSHNGHQQFRFTRNYMGAWRTWRRLHRCCWTGCVGKREEEREDLDNENTGMHMLQIKLTLGV